MSAHTPGPWQVSGISDKNGGDYVVSAGKFAVASVHNGVDWTPAAVGIPTSRQQRNARLIATAPELLEALQIARSYMAHTDWCNETTNGVDGDCECGHALHLERVNAVIDKATGAT